MGSNPDDPLWQRILPMGRELCPDQELFASPGESHDAPQGASQAEASFDELIGSDTGQVHAGRDSDDAAESFDLNLGGESSDATPLEEKLDLDLNLTGDGGGLETSQPSSEVSSESTDFTDVPPATADLEKPAASAAGEASQEKAQNSWEIDSGISDFGNIDFGLDDSDLLAGTDVVGTKLDLARAYIDMGDNESATDILKEVADEGNEQQKQEAKTLMEKIA